jgi:hypothetical protein
LAQRFAGSNGSLPERSCSLKILQVSNTNFADGDLSSVVDKNHHRNGDTAPLSTLSQPGPLTNDKQETIAGRNVVHMDQTQGDSNNRIRKSKSKGWQIDLSKGWVYPDKNLLNWADHRSVSW